MERLRARLPRGKAASRETVISHEKLVAPATARIKAVDNPGADFVERHGNVGFLKYGPKGADSCLEAAALLAACDDAICPRSSGRVLLGF